MLECTFFFLVYNFNFIIKLNLNWIITMVNMIDWSERVLFNAKWTHFQLYHGENILMRWLCRLCTRPTPWIWFCIVLVHWNYSQRVDMSLHSDTLTGDDIHQSSTSFSIPISILHPNHSPYLPYSTARKMGEKSLWITLWYHFWLI